MASESPMKLVVSIDVEEEGLFFGRYPRTPPGVTNVAELFRLEFIPRDFNQRQFRPVSTCNFILSLL